MASHTDFLLVTVNEHETQAVLQVFGKATGSAATPITLQGRVYRDLGTVNGTRIFHALSEMGAGGLGAAQQTVDKAIRALRPKAVIAVGVAFGVNESRQAIGDILISKQLRLYDLQRIGSKIVMRGDKPHASTRLINLFEGVAQASWKGPTVRPGVLLSGEKLVDNLDYREQLVSFETEAVGGEMEGAGVYVASHEHKVDWIVIKAICDWADGKKSRNKTGRQKKAAKNAAEFVLHALQQTRGGDLPDLSEALKREAIDLLRLLPGARVQHPMELLGKKIDCHLVLPSHFMPAVRVAVRCRDWKSRLSRKQCSLALADYHLLLEQRVVDQVILVTRNGISPSASDLFDERRLIHLSLSQLFEKVLDPTRLVDNMSRLYAVGGLDQYYVEQRAFAPPLDVALRNYASLYNEFVDFALETRAFDYSRAARQWVSSGGNADVPHTMSQQLFEQCVAARKHSTPVALEPYVLKWLVSEGEAGMAILGSYGTGKSSFAKRIAHVCAEAYRRGESGRVPLLIELKEFGAHQDIAGLITHELVNRHGIANGSFEVFRQLNAAGRFFIILDGFDEMKQGMTADSLLFNFFQISSLSEGKSKVLLCGRPTIFENQLEQNRILKGDLSTAVSTTARYIQIELAPFSISEVCEFLRQYSKVTGHASEAFMSRFIAELSAEAVGNPELRDLVQRPVHLPMLAAVAPRLKMRAREIQRAKLYGAFIDAIIEREMLKRRSEFRSTYTTDARKRFAISVAVQILKDGESRSIRTSELPDSLFDEFVAPGRPKEAVRRDLVSACFLERKPPDILYFPHKSFLEYLAAIHVAEMLRGSSENPNVAFGITNEIFAFVFDFFTEEDWVRILDRRSPLGLSVFTAWVRHKITQKNSGISEAVERKLVDAIPFLSHSSRAFIVEWYEGVDWHGETPRKTLRPAGRALLERCLSDESDEVAVHAYRALSKSRAAPSAHDLARAIGSERVLKWVRMGWLHGDPSTWKKLHARLRHECIQLLVLRHNALAAAGAKPQAAAAASG